MFAYLDIYSHAVSHNLRISKIGASAGLVLAHVLKQGSML
jgi:hypothetical protein